MIQGRVCYVNKSVMSHIFVFIFSLNNRQPAHVTWRACVHVERGRGPCEGAGAEDEGRSQGEKGEDCMVDVTYYSKRACYIVGYKLHPLLNYKRV